MSDDAHITTKTHGRILVLDDDVDTRYHSSDVLKHSGCRVDVALDGCTALRMLQRNPYDLAILNLETCGIDGLSLYRAIKELRRGTVTIIVTPDTVSETAEEAVAAGAWQVVPKPVDLPQLLQLLDRSLEHPLVMLVDDDPDLCAKLRDVLPERLYRVFAAHDGLEVVRPLKHREHKVVLVDTKLSYKLGGVQVYQQVRQANPEARGMVITGRRTGMRHIVRQLLAEAADAVCYMRSDTRELRGTVDRLPEDERGSGDYFDRVSGPFGHARED